MKNWSDIKSATNSQILDWAGAQPWSREMAACHQDAQWHAEGDVWTHTKMVCAELERLSEWTTLDRLGQIKLLFVALFHDSGKPATTAIDPDSGRTRSPKHSLVGAEIARRALRELECDLRTREEIVSLVRYHGRPPYLLEKENPEHEIIWLSWLVDTRLLYYFALADTRGRHAKEMARPEENLHLWKVVAEEQNCFGTPFKFANDQARFLFYRDHLSSLHYTPHENYRCTVTLMSGLPGAGKTLGLHETDQSFQSFLWIPSGPTSTSMRQITRAKSFRLHVKNAVNICARASTLPSTPRTLHAKCANAGLTCLPITQLELKSYTLNPQ